MARWPFPALRDLAAPIERTLAALAEAEQRRSGLYVPEAQAAAERAAALDAARRVYNLMHPRLRLLFPRDERLVESCFARLRREPGAPAEETDEQPTG